MVKSAQGVGHRQVNEVGIYVVKWYGQRSSLTPRPGTGYGGGVTELDDTEVSELLSRTF